MTHPSDGPKENLEQMTSQEMWQAQGGTNVEYTLTVTDTIHASSSGIRIPISIKHGV